MDYLSMMEPITYENFNTLKPGDWIWDNNLVERRDHKRSLANERHSEPFGFRQIHILDINDNGYFGCQPFMLSANWDSFNYGAVWTYFELDRFYKFKEI